jgi:IclR family acetate operon transcriptional repressor
MLQKLGKVLALFSPEQPELSVREIARVFRWPKSTAYRILSRIEASGFLDRDESSGAYRLGIRLAAYGELARHSTSLQRVVSPWLRRLSDATSETATLMLFNGIEGVTVDVVESFQPLMLPGLLGGSMALHATAGGKALLAWAPPGRQAALMQRPLPRFTPTTITDVTELMRELEKSRKRGYTTVNGERVEDVYGVAAPIFDHRGDVSAALTVGGPRRRVTAKWDVMAAAVLEASAAVSAALGFHARAPVAAGRPARIARQTPAAVKRAAVVAHHTNGRSTATGPSRATNGVQSNGHVTGAAPRRAKREISGPSRDLSRSTRPVAARAPADSADSLGGARRRRER